MTSNDPKKRCSIHLSRLSDLQWSKNWLSSSVTSNDQKLNQAETKLSNLLWSKNQLSGPVISNDPKKDRLGFMVNLASYDPKIEDDTKYCTNKQFMVSQYWMTIKWPKNDHKMIFILAQWTDWQLQKLTLPSAFTNEDIRKEKKTKEHET